MSILSFAKLSSERRRAISDDWSNQEMADFFRAHRLLVESGAAIGLDRGLSDEAEPWLVFYDTATQEVFLHIARIDGMCLLVCDHLGIQLRASRVEHLVDKFEEAIRSSFSVRAERASNVIAHPASRIIMSISAVFLLFKLDSTGSAMARDDVGTAANDPHGRKEISLPARAQAALARIFEAADNPVAVAALASVILASDLLSSDAHAPEFTPLPETLLFQVEQQLASNSLPSHGVLAQPQDVTELIAFADDAPPPVTVEMPVALVPVVSKAGALIEPGELHAHHTDQLVFQYAGLWTGRGSGHSAPQGAPVLTAVSTPATPAEQSAPEQTEKVASTTAVTLALQALGELTSAEWSGFRKPATTDVDPAKQPELAAAVVPEPEPEAPAYGYMAETALTGDELMIVLRHMITGIGRFDLESQDQGNMLLVEQVDVDRGNPALLGIWNNTMADGSTISVVGQIDLLDDITGFLNGFQLVA